MAPLVLMPRLSIAGALALVSSIAEAFEPLNKAELQAACDKGGVKIQDGF